LPKKVAGYEDVDEGCGDRRPLDGAAAETAPSNPAYPSIRPSRRAGMTWRSFLGGRALVLVLCMFCGSTAGQRYGL
jgi:hypothetical protein